MGSVEEIIEYVSKWRSSSTYTTYSDGTLTEESLLDLLNDINRRIEKLSFDAPEGKSRTLLYSNYISGEYGSRDYVDKIIKSDRISFSIHDIKEAKLMGMEMQKALSKTVGNDAVAARIMMGEIGFDPSSGYVSKSSPYGVRLSDGRKALSITDMVSGLFAERTIKGDIFIIMPNADTNSVLFQTELLRALNNKSVTSINGEPIAKLRARYSSEGLLGVFNYLKSENAKLMDGLVKPDGKGGYDVNVDPFVKNPSEAWLNSYEKHIHENKSTLESLVKTIDKMSIESKPLEAYISKLKLNYSDTAQLTRSVKIMESVIKGDGVVASTIKQLGANNMALYMASRSGTMKALGAVGSVLLAIDAVLTIKQAAEAYNKGDGYTGTKILHDWGWRTIFGLGSATAAMQLGLPLALLAIAGSSLVLPTSVAMLVGVMAELGLGFLGWNAGSFIGGGIGDLVWSLMDQAGLLPARIDPIVLDISGLGITTKSVTDGVYYDLDNNGFAEKTGWIDAKSGILVLDRDGNGKIEAGKELFGDRTILDDGKTASSGFAALAALDSNHDGVIDTKDAKFSELRIWIDKDGNGVSTPDELLTLEEAGIKSLNLSNEFVGKVDENGNTIARVGSFTRTDGTTATMKEFFLQRDTADVQMTNSVEVPEDIMSLPEIHPMGNTYSLRQAMARDTTGALKQLVQDFMNANDTSLRQAKLQDILFAWVGASQINPTSRGSSFDARKLAVLETVTGTSYRNSPTSSPTAAEAPILERSYTTLLESIYTMLSMQTSLADVFRKFNYSLDLESENPIKLDVSSVQAYLDEQLQSNAVTGEKMLAEITRALRNRGLISDAEFTHLREHFAKKSIKYQRIIDTAPLTTMTGTDVGDSINGVVDRDNVIAAGDGNDTLIGSVRNDLLYGDAGDDYLRGLNGNDTLVGGQGNDRLEGGEGDDTYIFNKGDGVDVISETKGVDTIQFGEGITPDDVVARVVTAKSSSDYVSLELSVKGTNDTITVEKQFGYKGSGYKETPDCQIEKVAFADGTVWNLEEIHTRAHSMSGTDKSDFYHALDDKPFTYHGLAGSDSLVGGVANDLLYGDAGDDYLRGLNGNDTLVGGQGNDRLEGGEGDDTYIFNKGDGVDVISETKGVDTIQFGEGITPDDVVARVVTAKSSSDYVSLELSVKGTNDTITVEKQFGYKGSGYKETPDCQIEKVAFADGTVWNLEEIHTRAHSMSGTDKSDFYHALDDKPFTYHGLAGSDSLVGGVANDLLYGDAGDDYLRGLNGNDTLVGGQGNDRLEGGEGDDTYIFNKGDGVDVISETKGVDTIQFGEGITPDDVVARVVTAKSSSDYVSLELSVKGTNDTITVEKQFGYKGSGYKETPDCQIEKVAFADGTVWNLEEIHTRAHSMSGTDKSDFYHALDDKPFTYHGLAGSDSLVGGVANDLLYGDAGDDYLRGLNGNDTLVGGQGNDRLEGGEGDDTYIFNKGDGVDVISETKGVDTIQFGEGITPDDVVARVVTAKSSSDYVSLELSVKGTNDTITVEKQFGYKGSGYKETPDCQIEKVAFADGTVWNLEEIHTRAHSMSGTDKSDFYHALDDKPFTYHGLAGSDSLVGGVANDLLYGDAGDDYLRGLNGNDTLVGGQGNDRLEGGEGDDTYIFNKGDGVDVISETKGVDTIQFGEGITPDDVVARVVTAKSSSDYVSLELSVKGTNDTITVEKQFGYKGSGYKETPDCQIEKVAFADGTVWNLEEIHTRAHSMSGTDKSDFYHALDDKPFTYHGLAGSDSLVGGVANDLLYGDAGDDYLRGLNGNDTLVGGQGNDRLEGGEGDDTYIFNKGDGVDVISETKGVDTIQFGEGITPDDVVARVVTAKSSSDYVSLELSVKGTNDTITVEKQFGYKGSGYKETPDCQIEKVAFADGTVWNLEEIHTRAHSMSGTDKSDFYHALDDKPFTYHGLAGSDSLVGGVANDLLYGDAGDDYLRGLNGNDTLVGGQGNDRLEGGEGDDTYIFNKGDGVDVISETKGVDTIQFGEGITPDDVVARVVTAKSSSDYVSLELSVKGTNDTITVEKQFGYKGSGYKETPDCQIEKVAFADGTVWNLEEIHTRAHSMSGTDKSDFYHALDDKPFTYHGLAGSDSLVGGVANDLLYGDAGDDYLRGLNGNDTLVGGQGNDRLEGGEGDDTYIFNKGDGVDVISETKGVADEIRLGHESTGVIFEHVDKDLRVRMPGSLDVITISSWYQGDNYKIETFKSTDGNVISHTRIESLIQAMSSFQKDTGMTWEQAIINQPAQVQAIVQEYWTAPTT